MDMNGNIRPIMLMNELQAMADAHAESLGLGMTFCKQTGLAWVALFYHVDVLKSPTADMDIILETWPSGRDRLRAVRDFKIIQADTNETLVNATSQWIMIDMNTRRPAPLDERVANYEVITERALDVPFDKFPDFAPDSSQIIIPRYDDVDINQHVNNAVYAVWATEAVGFEFRKNHSLRRISLNFKKEIPAGTRELNIETTISGNVSHHRITGGDVIHAYVICEWK
jgi:acyl-ACP thioesterase